MKRRLLKQCVREIALEVEQRPYDYWVAADLPMVYESTYQNQPIQVEIVLLELNAEYVQLGISVHDDGFLSAYCPPSFSVVIRSKEEGKKKG